MWIVLRIFSMQSYFREGRRFCRKNGLEPWDGSRDLYGMFSSQEIAGMEELLKDYVPNYRINLVDANNIGDIKRFQTDLQQIFGMLKYRGDKEKLISPVF